MPALFVAGIEGMSGDMDKRGKNVASMFPDEQELERLCCEFRTRFGKYLVGDRYNVRGNRLYWDLAQIIAAIKVMPFLREKVLRDPSVSPLIKFITTKGTSVE